jgi:hypothetical protein
MPTKPEEGQYQALNQQDGQQIADYYHYIQWPLGHKLSVGR